jgi:hypothetical protein
MLGVKKRQCKKKEAKFKTIKKNSMQKICLHCGNPFEATRASKKYCCDSCRQLAFYKRSDVSESVVAESIILPTQDDYTETLSGHNDATTVKLEAFNVNKNQCFTEAVSTVIPVTVNKEQLQTAKPQASKENYEWIYSSFIENLRALIEDSEDFIRFDKPSRHWDCYDLEKIKWISLRLRCLLENLLRLSNELSVAVSTLILLRDGFTSLIATSQYKYLPANYPYSTLMKELERRLTQTIKEQKKHSSIQIKFSRKRKAELIAARFMLAAIVPKTPFNELWGKRK